MSWNSSDVLEISAFSEGSIFVVAILVFISTFPSPICSKFEKLFHPKLIFILSCRSLSFLLFSSNSLCVNVTALALLSLSRRRSLALNVVWDSLLE